MVAFALGQQTNGHLESDGRRLVALLAITGSISDARAVFLEATGSTEADWAEIERILTPMRRFVLDGEPPYVSMMPLAEYQPVKTPAGDCANDALPFELQNHERMAIVAMMAGDTSSS